MNENGEIKIVLESDERTYQFDTLGLNFNSSDSEIISALTPVLSEDTGVNMQEQFEDGYWTIKRTETTGNIHIFPKSTAGRDRITNGA